MLSIYKSRTLYYNYSKEWKWWQHACVWTSLFFVFRTHATASVTFVKHNYVQLLLPILHTHLTYKVHVYCVMYSVKENNYNINTTQLSIGYKHSYKIQWKLCSFITKTVLNSYLFPCVKTMCWLFINLHVLILYLHDK